MVTFGSHVVNHQFQPFLSGVYAGVILNKRNIPCSSLQLAGLTGSLLLTFHVPVGYESLVPACRGGFLDCPPGVHGRPTLCCWRSISLSGSPAICAVCTLTLPFGPFHSQFWGDWLGGLSLTLAIAYHFTYPHCAARKVTGNQCKSWVLGLTCSFFPGSTCRPWESPIRTQIKKRHRMRFVLIVKCSPKLSTGLQVFKTPLAVGQNLGGLENSKIDDQWWIITKIRYKKFCFIVEDTASKPKRKPWPEIGNSIRAEVANGSESPSLCVSKSCIVA